MKFYYALACLFIYCFCQAQKYIETMVWIDETKMNDNKVDGVIYIKRDNTYLVDSVFLESKILNLSRVIARDDADRLEKAADILKSLNGGTLLISKILRIHRPVTLADVKGMEITGITARFSLQGGLFTSSAIEFVNNGSLTITDFMGLSIKKLNFLNKTAAHKNILTLKKGYNFEISEVNIRSVNSRNFVGITLGAGSGAEAVFMGSIRRVNIISDGGTGIYSGEANTSLTFMTSYLQGCRWEINGTAYSSWINCGVDGSPDHGYIIRGGANSKAHTLTFLSCGAEAAQKSGWYFGSGVYAVELIGAHAGLNNVSYSKNIGELATFDNAGPYDLTNIKISSPVIMKRGKDWEVFVTNNNTGKITFTNLYDEAFTAMVGGTEWDRSKLIIVQE